MATVLRHPVQRIGPMARLPALLRDYGVSLSEVLDDLPVEEADLQPDAFLPIRLISEILNRSSARTGAPIGLLLGKSQNHLALGALGQLMSLSDTLGSAISTFVSFQIAHSTAAAAHLSRFGDDYAFGFGLYGPELGSSQIYDAAAAVGCNIVRDLTGGSVAPEEILLSRPMPSDPAPFRELAGCPVRFNQSHTCIIISQRSMKFPLTTADKEAHERLLARFQSSFALGRIGIVEQVRHAIRTLLFAGRASLPDVAAHLNIHPRTLERRLAEENAAFATLKDEVRLAAGCELLALTDVPASDIAAALGYATPSAFVRAFRRWAGKPPTAWRREPLSSKGKQMP
jgi:AraC-like DNA-binding protein